MATKKLKANDSSLGVDSKTYNYSPKYLRLKTVDQAPGNYWHYEANRAGESMSTVLIAGFFNGSTLAAGDTLKVNATDTAGMFDILVSNGVVTLTAMGGGGEPGPQGPKGDQGEKGEKGDQGIQGVKGDTGAAGKDGEQGAKGDTGATGPQGATGATGAQGIQGVKGDTGAKGETGPKGDKGDQGDPAPVLYQFNIPVNILYADDDNMTPQVITLRSASGSSQDKQRVLLATKQGLVQIDQAFSLTIPAGKTLKLTGRATFYNAEAITQSNYYVNFQVIGKVGTNGQLVNLGTATKVDLDKSVNGYTIANFSSEDNMTTDITAIGVRINILYAQQNATAMIDTLYLQATIK